MYGKIAQSWLASNVYILKIGDHLCIIYKMMALFFTLSSLAKERELATNFSILKTIMNCMRHLLLVSILSVVWL